MPITVQNALDQISEEIGRNTVHDTKIRRRLDMAGRWFENNVTMQYMRRFVSFTLSATKKSVTLPAEPKAFEFMRYTKNNGEFVYLPKVEAQDIIKSEDINPTGWWLDGEDFIRFDNAPAEDLAMEMMYAQFTDFSALQVGDTPPLLQKALDGMVAQAVTYMVPILREPELLTIYKPMRDEAVRVLTLAEDELKFSATDVVMGNIRAPV